MRLPYSIALTLAFITCLSSFMLGLGQNDFLLPLLMFAAAVCSLYLTDFRGWIRLGDWTVNVLVLLIVFCTIGEMLHNRAEDLAFSIARTLVFVEMVLLFREKATRFCWQILLISLLQVVVATVMQQSLLFGLLLLVYVFSGLCAFVLIFLQSENRYFRRHSYLRTFLSSVREEIALRQDRGRLVRIALMTLMTGPLSLVLTFSPSRPPRRASAGPAEATPPPGELLRSFFAIFSRDRTEDDTAAGAEKKARTAWHQALWESVDEPDAEPEGRERKPLSKHRLDPVPRSRSAPALRDTRESGEAGSRFPLLREQAAFSAGTMISNGLEGGHGELFRHLIRGTLFSLIVAALLFCLIPRIGKIEFRQMTLSFGRDNWYKPVRSPVGTVGFTEEVRLGSLGTVLPYHREVLFVRFENNPDRTLPPPDGDVTEESYDSIKGATVYFHGVALETYGRGVWKSAASSAVYPERWRGRRGRYRPTDIPNRDAGSSIFSGPFSVVPPGCFVKPEHSGELFFEKDSDLVSLHLTIRPLDSRVFFAPWPFFRSRVAEKERPFLQIGRNRVDELHPRNETISTTIYTTVFKHGVQLPLIPCQEVADPRNLLQLPKEGLESLIALARRWDEESGLPKEDVVGRASHMERQFLLSDHFKYQLGGTVRDYALDPLEDFVDRNPAGHCEYFAGALALMLRSVGIGSRVIVGFKSFVPGSGEQGCPVRQSDAHTWVEVYLPPETIPPSHRAWNPTWWTRGGWYRLDPTPAGAERTMIKKVSFHLSDIMQRVDSLWSDFVLNMNAEKQTNWIYNPIRGAWRYGVDRFASVEFWRTTASETYRYYKRLIFRDNGTVWRARDWFLLAVPVVISLALLAMLYRLLRLIRALARKRSLEKRRRKASIEFYVRMERLLTRYGRERRQGETPLEFVRQSEFAPLAAPVVDAFYRVRFGNIELTDEELRDIRGILDRLERRITEHERA